MKIFAALLMFMLAGCGSLQVSGDADATRIAVKAGVVAYISQSSDPVATASRVKSAAEDARAMLDIQAVSVAEIKARLLERIAKADMDIGQKAVLMEVVDAVQIDIGDGVEEGAIPPETRVRLNVILSWVESTANLYL